MEAVLGMTTVIFLAVVGAAVVQGVTFLRRHRFHVQVTSKAANARNVDVENPEAGIEPELSKPPRSRLGSLYSTTQKWPGYDEHRWAMPIDRIPIPMSHIYSCMPPSAMADDAYGRAQTEPTAITQPPTAPPPQHQPQPDTR